MYLVCSQTGHGSIHLIFGGLFRMGSTAQILLKAKTGDYTTAERMMIQVRYRPKFLFIFETYQIFLPSPAVPTIPSWL